MAGRGAVPVLGDGDAGSGHDDRRERRDVEGAASIAAGAARVEHRRRRGDGVGELEDGAGEAVELVDGLALGPKGHQESADLDRRHIARHDRPHGRGGLIGRQRLVRHESLQSARPEVRVGLAHEGRTLAVALGWALGGWSTLSPRRLRRWAHAGVVQWQNASFPSSKRGFDSPHPLSAPVRVLGTRRRSAANAEIDDGPLREVQRFGKLARQLPDAVEQPRSGGRRQ